MKRLLIPAIVVLISMILSNRERCLGQDASEDLRIVRFTDDLYQNVAIGQNEGRWLIAHTVHNPLGIEVEETNQALRSQLSLQDNQGLVVVNVPDDSEGAKIGLQASDVLLSIDQFPISTGDQLQQSLITLAEKEVTILLMRTGKLETLRAKLPAFVTVDFTRELEAQVDLNVEQPYRIGVTLSELDLTLRQHLKLGETEGLLITEVVPDSPAASVGLQANDILIRCNDDPITTVELINQKIQQIKSNPARFRVIRSGDPLDVVVTPKQETISVTESDGAIELAWRVADDRVLAIPQIVYETDQTGPIVIDNLSRVWLDRVGVLQRADASRSLQNELDALQVALDALKTRALQLTDESEKPSSAGSTAEALATERVMAYDRLLGKQRDSIPELAGLSLAASAYVTGLDSIDYSGCPQSLQDAFKKHRDAWHNMIEFLKQHDSLRGEMHELFEQIRALSAEQKEQLDAHQKQIMDSWSEIEKIANPG